MLPLHARGRIVDVRQAPDRRQKNDETGEITYTPSDQQIVTLLYPGVGTGEFNVGPLVPIPEVGVFVECEVTVRSYSGFVRNGSAGDARQQYSATGFRWIDDPTAAPAPAATSARGKKAA